LVLRKFSAEGPDRIWFTDITQHRARDGWVYCCAVLDAYSRRIVGWSIADHLRSELVVDALEMARWQRRPEPGTIVHADRGTQYTSWIFGHRLRQAGLLGSMGRVASSVDNAHRIVLVGASNRSSCISHQMPGGTVRVISSSDADWYAAASGLTAGSVGG
jgi:transposase InsO family protein